MTQEERKLLIKDLCARLPYGVKGKFPFSPDTVEIIGHTIPHDGEVFYRSDGNYVDWEKVENFKPYLRPMSSMTEKEEKEYNRALEPLSDFIFEQDEEFRPIQLYKNIPFELYEFFNSHYFDYRGLIEKGLALVAPEGMYK